MDTLIKVHLTEEVIEGVIRIRKKFRVKLPDAIILASAIENNLTLITRNIEDFKTVAPPDVLVNPFKGE